MNSDGLFIPLDDDSLIVNHPDDVSSGVGHHSHVHLEIPSLAPRKHVPNKRVETPARNFLIHPDPKITKSDTGVFEDYLTITNTVECLQKFMFDNANGLLGSGKSLKHVGVRDLFPFDPFTSGTEFGCVDKNLDMYTKSVAAALSHDYVAREVVENRNLKRALNAPMITAYNYYARNWDNDTKILIVGGNEGDDFARIRLALKNAGRERAQPVIDVVEPIEEYIPKLKVKRMDAPGQDWAMDVQTLHTLDRKGYYDVVLMHYSIHLVCRTSRAMQGFIASLFQLLSPKGRVIGCIMDPSGAQLLGEPDANSHSDNVRVVNRFLPDDEHEWGAVEISVGGHIFKDPILPFETLSDRLGENGFTLDAFPGRECATRMPEGVRSHMEPWYREADMRAVIYFEITRSSLAKPVSPPMQSGKPLKFTHAGDGSKGVFLREFNKGRAVASPDLAFLRCKQWWLSVKLDGQAAMLYGRRGDSAVTALLDLYGDLSVWVAPTPYPLTESFTSQVELVCDTGPPDIRGSTFVATAFVTDPQLFGVVPLNSFSSRMAQCNSALAAHPSLRFLGTKEWLPMNTEVLHSLWRREKWCGYPTDGIVFQDFMARFGLFKGLGSCRYLKPSYSVDLRFEQGAVVSPGPFKGVRAAVHGTQVNFEGPGFYQDTVSLPPDYADFPDGVYEVRLRNMGDATAPGNRPLLLESVIRARHDKRYGNSVEIQELFRRVFYFEDLSAVFTLRDWYNHVFDFRQICPVLCGQYLQGSDPSNGEITLEIERELRLLGMTYGCYLLFPKDLSGDDVFTGDQRANLHRLRYESYVQLWGDGEIHAEIQDDLDILDKFKV